MGDTCMQEVSNDTCILVQIPVVCGDISIFGGDSDILEVIPVA
jgi:hypothetical protein